MLLLPKSGNPAPLRGTNPGSGRLSVLASASTCDPQDTAAQEAWVQTLVCLPHDIKQGPMRMQDPYPQLATVAKLHNIDDQRQVNILKRDVLRGAPCQLTAGSESCGRAA